MTNIYQGFRFVGGPFVTADDHELPLRLDLFAHSPDGFEWGYGGSGPAQLALAILADHFGPDFEGTAVRLHQAFKGKVIARLDRTRDFRLTRVEVEAGVRAVVDQAFDEPRLGLALTERRCLTCEKAMGFLSFDQWSHRRGGLCDSCRARIEAGKAVRA